MPFHTVVDMWRPAALIGWRGTSLGAEGLQAWRLEPRAGGCLVTTEEVQRGPLPRLLAPLARSVSRATHQLWLTRLATRRGAEPGRGDHGASGAARSHGNGAPG